MKLLKVSLVLAALTLAGCVQPDEPPACTVAAPVVKERNEVIARRGALEVELAKVRTEWAANCIKEDKLQVAFESDRPSLCRKNADWLYPDVVTQQLLAEFKGDLTTPTTPTQAQ